MLYCIFYIVYISVYIDVLFYNPLGMYRIIFVIKGRLFDGLVVVVVVVIVCKNMCYVTSLTFPLQGIDISLYI